MKKLVLGLTLGLFLSGAIFAAPPFGHASIDAANQSIAGGSALDPDYAGNIMLHMYVDGAFYGAFLNNCFGGAGPICFGYEPLGVGSHTIQVYAIGVNANGAPDGQNVQLDGFPVTVSEIRHTEIRRTRDGRIITNGGSYPNDRVSRGEAYKVEIKYRTYNLSAGPYDIKVLTRVDGIVRATRTFKASALSNPLSGTNPNFFSWSDTVSTDPAFRNVYFEVYNTSGRLLSKLRLPIGSY